MDIFDNIGTYFSTYGLRIAFVICIIVIGILLTWLLSYILKKILYKTKIDDAAVSFIIAIFKIIMAVIIILICASILDLSTSSLIVSLSTVALAVALALKESFSNLANGILIIVNKPFKRGDYVSIGGIEGKIQNIRLLTVELVTFDNARIIMPNSTVLNGNVYNYSSLPIRRLDMQYSVAYGSDMKKVEEVLRGLCAKCDKILKSIDYSVYLSAHDSSSVTWTLKVWVNNVDYFSVKNSFPRLVYDAFEEAGITIPFNQLDVHIKNDGENENA